MKHTALVLLSIFVITSCSNNNNGNKKNQEGKEVISRYTNGSAQIEREFKIIDGKRVAIYEWEYYNDGNILKEGPLSENEKRDGNWKAFRRDGNLWSEGDFNDGKRQGYTKAYHENGAIFYDGNYNNGQKSGVWKFYDENGDFDYEIDYDARAKAAITIDSTKIKRVSN